MCLQYSSTPFSSSGKDERYKYAFNVCGTVPDVGGPCANKKGAVCQYNPSNGMFVAMIGRYGSLYNAGACGEP